MKTRPIIFNGEMVRAILEERKTQTRRVIKSQPLYPGLEKMVYTLHPFAPSSVKGTPAEGINIALEENVWCHEDWVGNIVGVQGKCPYGVPGDRLWVRETFFYDGTDNPPGIHYRASANQADEEWFKEEGWKWKPSIFMPRKFSRITLEITNIRVERVQDITPADYRAEGISTFYPAKMNSLDVEPMYRQRWIDLWDSINAKKHLWESNPWVWIIEFKVADD